ncbi:MAG: hypothetical protein U0269_02695 [Polyangiales bacterium]
MAYRDRWTDDAAPLSREVRGADDRSVQPWIAVPAALLFFFAQCAAGRGAAHGLALGFALALWYLIDHRTRRFSFVTEGDHIVLRSKVFGIFTVRTARYDLGATLWFDDGTDPYDDWATPGFTLTEAPYATPAYGYRSITFGSVRDLAAARAQFAQMNELVARSRHERAQLDVDRHRTSSRGVLAAVWSALDPDSIDRNAWGRVRSARLLAAIAHDTLGSIAAGSTVYFCPDDAYRSQHVADEITAVTLSEPHDGLYSIMGLSGVARPSLIGARVRFSVRLEPYSGRGAHPDPRDPATRRATIECERAFASAEIAGVCIDGAAKIVAVEREPCECTLAAALVIHGLTFEPGARVTVDAMNNVTIETQRDVTIDGRVTRAPAHVHFQPRATNAPRAKSAVTLASVLSSPESLLAPPRYAHTIRRAPA